MTAPDGSLSPPPAPPVGSMLTRACACGCGRSFTPRRADQHYREGACRQRAFQRRRSAGGAAPVSAALATSVHSAELEALREANRELQEDALWHEAQRERACAWLKHLRALVIDNPDARSELEALVALGRRAELCYAIERRRPPLPAFAEALVVSVGTLDVATYGPGTTARECDHRRELRDLPTLEVHPTVLARAAELAELLLSLPSAEVP